MQKKNWLQVICLLLLVVSCTACGQQKSYEHSAVVMDTVVTLSASGPEAKAAVDESFERLAVLEAMASSTIETSDVAKLRAAAGHSYVKLQPEVYHMLEVSQEYSRLSGGAWDVTTGPLVELWGVGTDHERLPSPEEIIAARRLVDWQKLRLRPEDQSAMLEMEGMSIDLGGIAKGMAIDEVRKIYAAHKIHNGLINMGASSLYGIGTNKEGKAWNVGIRHPRNDARDTYLGIVSLENMALSTSGDYERCFFVDGKRYHHILNPATGYPADSGAMSDTVVIDGSLPDSGMISDLLTTAVFVMGPEKGRAFLEELPEKVQGEVTGTDYVLYPADGFEKKLRSLHGDFSWADGNNGANQNRG